MYRYYPNAVAVEADVVDLLLAKTPVIEVHYQNRLVVVFTLPEWDLLLAEHGQRNVMLGRGKGGWHIPAEHGLIHRITTAVEALGDAPPMLSGKKQKAAVAVLVARGVSEEEAIRNVRALGAEKAVFA